MILFSIVLALLTIVLWFPALVDLASLVGTLLRTRDDTSDVNPSTQPPKLLFLIPAHNEHLLITHCVDSFVRMDYPATARRIVVIADNSTDDTATLARRAGAECLERFDTERRGKPHALAWALAQLDIRDFDACVIVDADTTVDRGFAKALAAMSPLDDIALQANIGTLNEWDNWLTRLAGVLARCRYEVTYRLRDAAGINCPLTGNGMCIGRRLLEQGWQAFSLTENWELYARYTASGIPIRYAHDARILTQQVRTMKQGQIQRSRWLAGRISVLRAWGSTILRSRETPLRDKLATVGELGALSPVLQLSAALLVGSVALVSRAPGSQWIAIAAFASVMMQLAATLVVLLGHPEPLATLSAFLYLPAYAIWRTAVAAGTMLVPGNGEWRKTERHSL
jgi:cellulose synthase/poly-beta-1,6-N-acetylglucosamine synthase-like glycosyltransferase